MSDREPEHDPFHKGKVYFTRSKKRERLQEVEVDAPDPFEHGDCNSSKKEEHQVEVKKRCWILKVLGLPFYTKNQ